jgi:uncharacterized membrane protein YdbT with pleckstrin-like domain
MNGSPAETVVYSGHPSWRSMLDFHLAGLVLALVAGVIGKLAAGWGIAVAAFAAVLLLSLVLGAIRRAATLYTISDRRLYIRRGILRRSEQHTTIERVQNVETSQSILERILAIGTLNFDTAATDDSVFAFTGVAHPRRVVAAVDQAQDASKRGEAEPAV